MREILFRGKRKNDGKWIYGYPLIDTAECSLKAKGECACPYDGSWAEIAYWSNECHEYVFQEVIPETVGQYTGLTDKNGQKIFEGDIVRYTDFGKENYYGIIKFGEYTGQVLGKHIGYFIHWTNTSLFRKYLGHWATDFQVIGNIHDNPELLGEVKE